MSSPTTFNVTETVDLESVVIGDGPPLVILHGLFGQAKNWGGLTKRLARDFTVHAVDLRSHGGSPAGEPVNYPTMAADLIAYCQRHDLESPMVIGHSMGGKVAMWAALSAPTSMSRLVVADIAPVTYDHAFGHYFQALKQIDLATLESRQAADAILASHIAEKPIRDFLLSNLARTNAGSWQWDIDLPSIEAGIDAITGWPTETPGHFTKPTLFLNGGASDYVTPDLHDQIIALFPAAEFVTMAGVGHWIHAEKPAEFLSEVTKFLAVGE
ncbi:MAG: alpha/beta fold hydrolase [Pseudomonadota bacterium]